MVLLLFAKIIALIVGGSAGWIVYTNLATIFENWIPIASGAGVTVFVFSILYFPLLRHIAEAISDRMSVAVHRGRHIRSGTGIEELPEAPPVPRCSLCGAPDGPICRSCQEEMNRNSTY
jgi:hypothetical protein